jgi:hypothetical protein
MLARGRVNASKNFENAAYAKFVSSPGKGSKTFMGAIESRLQELGIAYLLCSVAMRLRLSQVVNEPMFTVSAELSKSILPARKLF